MKRHCIDETCAICTLDRLHAHIKGGLAGINHVLWDPLAPQMLELVHDFRTGLRSRYKDVDAVVEFKDGE